MTTTDCCSPILTETITPADAEATAARFKALADPIRIQLISLIANSPDGEICACDMVEPVGRSQPTVSHHLSILADAGLLQREQRGKWAWYRLNPDGINGLRAALGSASY